MTSSRLFEHHLASEPLRSGLKPVLQELVPCNPAAWACPGPLSDADFARVRRRLILDHFKWDPQVGDVGTLARFPLVLPAEVVRGLFDLAEELAAETEAAEAELLDRPHL